MLFATALVFFKWMIIVCLVLLVIVAFVNVINIGRKQDVEFDILRILEKRQDWTTQDQLYNELKLKYHRQRIGAALTRLEEKDYINTVISDMRAVPYHKIFEFFGINYWGSALIARIDHNR